MADVNWNDYTPVGGGSAPAAEPVDWAQFDVVKPASTGRKLADIATAFAGGAVGATKAIADAGGAGNAVSQQLGSAQDTVQSWLSPQRQAEKAARAQTIREAEQSGSVLREVGAQLGGIAEAPVSTVAEAAGSVVPIVASMFTPVGRSAAARTALGAGLGAAQGAGSVKGSIHEAVEQQQREQGATPEAARQAADRAQAYIGPNADNIALGAGLGLVTGTTGVERLVSGALAGRATNQALLRRAATGAVTEGLPEAVQGGQERFASNVAQQREGGDVPTWQGVAGQAVAEGVAGGLLGAGTGAAVRGGHGATGQTQGEPGQQPIAEPAPDAAPAPAAAPAIDPNAGPLSKAAVMAGDLGLAPTPVAPAPASAQETMAEAMPRMTEEQQRAARIVEADLARDIPAGVRAAREAEARDLAAAAPAAEVDLGPADMEQGRILRNFEPRGPLPDVAEYAPLIEQAIKPELRPQYRRLLAEAMDENRAPRKGLVPGAREAAAQALHATFSPDAFMASRAARPDERLTLTPAERLAFGNEIDFAPAAAPAVADPAAEQINQLALAQQLQPGAPLRLDQAHGLRRQAAAAGIPVSVVPHPSGRGYDVQPTVRLPEEQRAAVPQAGPAVLGFDAGPSGRMVAGPEGVRPETRAEAVANINAIQAKRQALDAERQRRADLGMSNITPVRSLPVEPVTPALTYDNSPSGRMVAGADGVRPETRSEAVSLINQQRQRRQEVEAERARRADLGLSNLTRITPLDEQQDGAAPGPQPAPTPSPEVIEAPVREVGAGPASTITMPDGRPFATREQVQAELQRQGLTSTHEAAPAQGDPSLGFVGQQRTAARPANWRTNAMQAGRVARGLGLEPRGKRLAEIVADIDAADTARQLQPAGVDAAETGALSGNALKRENPVASSAAAAAAQEQRNAFREVERRRTAPGNRARAQSAEANPMRAFLGKYGVALGLRAEFAPGRAEQRAAMVPGYGPIFRKTGIQLDALAQAAVEEGFLVEPDTAQLHGLISRALRGERVIAQYADGVADAEMQALVARQRAFDEDARAEELASGLNDAEVLALTDDDIPWDSKGNTTTEAAMRSLGFSEQEIQDAIAQESRIAQEGGAGDGGADEAAARAAQGNPAQRTEQTQPGRAADAGPVAGQQPSTAPEEARGPANKSNQRPSDDGEAVLYSATSDVPPGSGLTLEQAQKAVDDALAGLRNPPPVRVVLRSDELGVDAPDGVMGAAIPGEGRIVIVASAHRSADAVVETLFHEMFHLGVRNVLPGSDYVQAMLDLAKRDARVRQYAIDWKEQAPDAPLQLQVLRDMGLRGSDLTARYEALAIEEGLAVVAQELRAQQQAGTRMGLRIRALANWLAGVAERMGMQRLAGRIRNMTYNEAERFVLRAIESAGEGRTPASAGGPAGLARYRTLGDNPASQRVGATLQAMTATNAKKIAHHKATDLRPLGLGFLGRRQLVDVYGDMLPELRTYSDLMARMDADKNEAGAGADQLAQNWAKLADERALAELMHDSTLAQMDPAADYMASDNRVQYGALRRRFEALTPEAREVYTKARDTYRQHMRDVRAAIKERIERAGGMSSERKAAMLKRMDDEFFGQIKGVYFPLARFGQYVVVVKDAEGKTASVSRAETMAEADAMRGQMATAFPKDKGFSVGKVLKAKDFVAERDTVGRGFMEQLYGVLDKQGMDAAQRAELEDALGQLYLSSLPDLSWAKHGIHRKGTAGFSQDARRAFAQNVFHGASYLAKLRYGDQLQDQLGEMQRRVDQGAGDAGFDSVKGQQVVDEMVKRHDAAMNPKTNALSTALTSVGFMFHLGLSPASAMVNLTQTALVAYPVMGARWGFRKSGAALLKASQEAVRGKNDITGSLSPDEKAAFDEAVRSGVIDVTMAHDLAGIAQGEDRNVSHKLRPVMNAASWMFHHAEKFNRQVTFVAAYRLARETGISQQQAYQDAVQATYDGHFDYSANNRPRVMQGNVARVLLLFKQYGQNMVYTLVRNAQQALTAGKPEDRAAARKALAGLLTTHAMAAGVLGLPMVTTLLAAASMLGGDDDEPWDAQVAMQNMLADAFGQKPAEALSHGLSRLTPWDISGRVGLNQLILPDLQEGLEGQRLGESAMAAALGPVAGIGINALKGLQEMSEGRYQRGLETMAPSVLRGPLKAWRYETEGVKDKTGIVVQDQVDAAAVAGQAVGFSPSSVRNAYEGKSAIVGQDRALQARRSALVEQFAMAAMAKDEEGKTEAREAIQRFNEKNPARRIQPMQLAQSVRMREKRIREAEDGVYLPKKRRDAMEAGRFAVEE
ncbi:PLxRFG domain-containing protein [Delftia sp. WSY_7]|uniref:PLxRFG domain-containing protein n=1 Tax=Delftia sp. WSY_7 TaxID=3367202 RepID=UPI00370A4C63